ncbi:hypothetical protein MAIT1_00075 [Magnetofaba australis IT-1]|uniref:Replication initiation factor n=1 Tax=Magnetofaba australis IT-1 TaxID=1434232 RepID=A0A1Y2K8E3_9PROT|nr:hypothetical protein MAIT1_00075 [Magnetofaba australis IT-1]
MRILAESVDTVRQMYRGKIRESRLAEIQAVIDSGDCYYRHGGWEWHVAKMGKKSGYLYKLQNNQWGYIILLKSFYKKPDEVGTHLKIEVAPTRIAQTFVGELQGFLDSFAYTFLLNHEPCECAIHLAVDIQGWDLPEDFEKRLKRQGSLQRTFNGIQELEYQGLDNVCATYGKRETVMFGKASGLQFTVYRKDLEMVKSDKVDFYRQLWGEMYEADKPVWRIEARFHHSVMREIGNGTDGARVRTYYQATDILTDLWRYALERNRLMDSVRFIDPMWQLLMEDVEFIKSAQGLNIKRVKKQDAAAIEKNIGLMLGNAITVAVRRGVTFEQLIISLRNFALWEDIEGWYLSKDMTFNDFVIWLRKKVHERRMTSKVAA